MPYCPKCGHLNPPGSKFCEVDGTPLTAQAPAVVQGGTSGRGSTASLATRKIHWGFVAEWVLANLFAVALWVAVLVLGTYFLGLALYNMVGGEAGLPSYSLNMLFQLVTGQISVESIYAWIIGAALILGLLSIVLYGLIVGGFQWFVIRNRLGQKAPWVSRTMIGVFVAIAFALVAAILTSHASEIWSSAIFGMAAGLGMALLQWSALRSRIGGSAVWIVANPVAIFVAVLTGIQIGNINNDAGLVSAALIITLATGLAMDWLLPK
jgi:hypothetical protein